MRAGMAIVLATMTWVAQAAEPAIYRWQDAQGQWHFSDAPHPGATALTLRQGSVVPFAKPDAALEERQLLTKSLARATAPGAASASQAAGAALARKKAYCSQRRDYLDSRDLKAWCDLACRLPMEHEYDRECVQGVRW